MVNGVRPLFLLSVLSFRVSSVLSVKRTVTSECLSVLTLFNVSDTKPLSLMSKISQLLSKIPQLSFKKFTGIGRRYFVTIMEISFFLNL